MYGKSFQSKYTGSMIGAGFNVFAVWDYITTNNRYGVIELNPSLVAFILAGSRKGALEEVITAIEYLASPDPASRSKELDGRRIVQEGQFQYRVVNWELYEGIKSKDALREYNRVKQSEYRARKKANGPTLREQVRRAVEEDPITKADQAAMNVKWVKCATPPAKPLPKPVQEYDLDYSEGQADLQS